VAEAIERFVLAHEYAHLIEGHLGSPDERTPADWPRTRRAQSFLFPLVAGNMTALTPVRARRIMEMFLGRGGPRIRQPKECT
jgi:hypothetical protein